MSNFKVTSRLCLGLLVVFLMIGWKAETAQTQSTADKPVEQVRKNIQVLKGLPYSQLFLLMNFVGDSLGVNCDHCHVKGEQNPQTGEDTWLWERQEGKGTRVSVTNTMLGPLNVQWDFSDYRDVSGLKLPFLIRTSDVSSYDMVVRRFSEIKIDSSVSENVFDTPRWPSSP